MTKSRHNVSQTFLISSKTSAARTISAYNLQSKLSTNLTWQRDGSKLGLNLGNFAHYFSQFQEYLSNYLEEQITACVRSLNANDSQALKLLNESISKSAAKMKQVFVTLVDLVQQFQKLPFKERTYRQSDLLFQLCEEVLTLKVELQTIAT